MSARARGRLVVLVSGRGSNLQALLDACARAPGDESALAADVALVVSDKADAPALQRARDAGVPAVAVAWAAHRSAGGSRAGYDRRLADVVARANPDLVILAGFLRVLTPAFLDAFADRVLNLHPALPGAFPGLHAIERAHAAFARGEVAQTGVMVHRVIAEVDAGAPIAVEAVPLRAGEALADLEARVHAVEHRLLVAAVDTALAAIPDAALAAVRAAADDRDGDDVEGDVASDDDSEVVSAKVGASADDHSGRADVGAARGARDA